MLVVFHFYGSEKFQLPPDYQTWGMMTMFAMTSGILSVYYWNKCSVNLGPIAAYSFYSILTFPSVIAFDVFFVQE